jgi:hypothetical protein
MQGLPRDVITGILENSIHECVLWRRLFRSSISFDDLMAKDVFRIEVELGKRIGDLSLPKIEGHYNFRVANRSVGLTKRLPSLFGDR